jgi:hypothetical protein
MFQQFYQPHQALNEFVNNIMIHQVRLDTTQTPPAVREFATTDIMIILR